MVEDEFELLSNTLSFVVALVSHALACIKLHGHERSVPMSPPEQNQKDRG